MRQLAAALYTWHQALWLNLASRNVAIECVHRSVLVQQANGNTSCVSESHAMLG